MILQIAAITFINLQSIVHRLGSSSLIVVGTAGIVCVFCGLFSMASGLEAVTLVGEAKNRVLMLSKGTPHEFGSFIPAVTSDRLEQISGFSVRSKERLIAIRQKNVEKGRDDYFLIRGLAANWRNLRDEVEILEGRVFEPGRAEAIVGRALLREFPKLRIGGQVPFYKGGLTVVGIFEAEGSLSESEIFTDIQVISDRYGQNFAHTIRGRLDQKADFQAVADHVDRVTKGEIRLVREVDVLPEHVKERTVMINGFAGLVVVIMALGAVTASLATMYASVGSRSREIATLRVLGYRNAPIVTSVLVEALVLAGIGAFFGVCVVYALLEGVETATRGGFGNTLIFSFQISGDTLALCALLAIGLAVIGGGMASFRAVRQPAVQALGQKTTH